MPPRSSRRSTARRCRQLSGKRVALVASGGGGAAVALVGVARAFEEAGIEPAEIVGCSGGAIWGSMWAAGMSAQEMAEFSLRWKPEDYLDVQWHKLPRFALSALRGFTGLAKGEAVEQLFDERVRGMRVRRDRRSRSRRSSTTWTSAGSSTSARTRRPTCRSATSSGSRSPCRCSSSRSRCTVTSMSTAGSSRSGRSSRFSTRAASTTSSASTSCCRRVSSRRTSPAGQIASAASSRRAASCSRAITSSSPAAPAPQLGDRLTLIDPVEDSELHGTSFYDLFLDRAHWPRLIRQGYEAATEALELIESEATGRRRLNRRSR